MRYSSYLALVFFLCGCATQHQPRVYEPFFPSLAEGIFSPAHVYEIRKLESTPNLTLLQKKRLSDLYALESSVMRSDPLRNAIKVKRESLKAEIRDYEEELRQVSKENRNNYDPPKREEDPIPDVEVRFRVSEAQSLWNKDQNDEALEMLIPLREASLEDAGILKIEYLILRILLEKGDLPGGEESYRRIKEVNECGFEANQAALLLALRYFSEGNRELASGLYRDQCAEEDPQSAFRRDYWLARFELDEKIRKTKYERLVAIGFPEYYAILSRMHLQIPLELPTVQTASQSLAPLPYLAEPLEVARSVDRLLSRAEEALDANLKRDAGTFLVRAAQILRRRASPNDWTADFYAASLLQAAGNHLEALKIFNWLSTVAPDESRAAMSHPGLIRKVFPTPFKASVDFLAGKWNVDPDLIYGLMRQESAFNPQAISTADARGLMQMMPFLAKFLAKRWRYDGYLQSRDLLNAEENLKLSIFHLHQLEELVPHLTLIAASYNAGVTRTTHWWKKMGQYPLDVFVELIPILETRNYVKYVVRNYSYYKALRMGTVDLASAIPMVLPALPTESLLDPEKESPQGIP